MEAAESGHATPLRKRARNIVGSFSLGEEATGTWCVVVTTENKDRDTIVRKKK